MTDFYYLFEECLEKSKVNLLLLQKSILVCEDGFNEANDLLIFMIIHDSFFMQTRINIFEFAGVRKVKEFYCEEFELLCCYLCKIFGNEGILIRCILTENFNSSQILAVTKQAVDLQF